jgi:hypothetical protein
MLLNSVPPSRLEAGELILGSGKYVASEWVLKFEQSFFR